MGAASPGDIQNQRNGVLTMRRRPFKLAHAFRGLKVDEGVFCTPRSYAGIAGRLAEFQKEYPGFRVSIHTTAGVVHIRRTR